MKRLKIDYDGVTLFDCDVAELTWTDSANGVRVEGKTRSGGGGAGAGIINMLTAVSKAKTNQTADQHRAAYEEGEN